LKQKRMLQQIMSDAKKNRVTNKTEQSQVAKTKKASARMQLNTSSGGIPYDSTFVKTEES